MWAREILECCKLSWRGASDQNSEDQKTDRNMDRKGWDDEVSDGNEDFIGN